MKLYDLLRARPGEGFFKAYGYLSVHLQACLDSECKHSMAKLRYCLLRDGKIDQEIKDSMPLLFSHLSPSVVSTVPVRPLIWD